ncbi:hypothetical protein [Pseudoflavitalea rhizosphaerae]|uniref:hypothetical protein n=1 Tax=Pseudoflavitalea rhizosphaerae TaxID=1884793 RepID=UPI000F8C96BA|nr:hypothetical protein [Pseudoflavitalea rhizosphaerae]
MSKRVLTIYRARKKTLKGGADEHFYIEEKRPNGKWKRIPEDAGPYDSEQEAETVAKAYSEAHPNVEVRVVAEV